MSPWLHEISRLAAMAGCGAILYAGSRERAGDLVAARRIARRGGFVQAAATALQLAISPWLAWAACGTVLLSVGLLASGLSGAGGLLAGLSGKPRPTGWVAAALWLSGLILSRLAC